MAYDIINEIERLRDQINEMDVDGIIACLAHLSEPTKNDPKTSEEVRRGFIRMVTMALTQAVLEDRYAKS